MEGEIGLGKEKEYIVEVDKSDLDDFTNSEEELDFKMKYKIDGNLKEVGISGIYDVINGH